MIVINCSNPTSRAVQKISDFYTVRDLHYYYIDKLQKFSFNLEISNIYWKRFLKKQVSIINKNYWAGNHYGIVLGLLVFAYFSGNLFSKLVIKSGPKVFGF